MELVLREQVPHGLWIGSDAARNPANQAKESDTVIAATRVAHEISVDHPQFPITLPSTLPARPSASCPGTDVFPVARKQPAMPARRRPNPDTEVGWPGRTTVAGGQP